MRVDLHDFPREEYRLRWDKAKKLMETKRLDALIITDSSNYRLLAGMRSMTKNRPVVLVLPRKGKPVLVANTFLQSAAENQTWVEDIRTYDLPFSANIVALCLRELGLSDAAIGAELDIGCSPSFISVKLQNELPNARFVDASDVFSEMRLLKTDAEVESLRKACEITGKAYEELFRTLKEGITEREIAELMFTLFMTHGADVPIDGFLLINSGGKYVGVPTEKPLRKGDLLWFDSGCSYRGYHSDFSRSCVVGHPSQEQAKMWVIVSRIVDECIEVIRPGIKLNEIHQTSVKACEELGLDPNTVSGALAKRRPHIGHSVGLDAVEPPMIDSLNSTIVRSNMVLAIEPAIVRTNAVYHLEQIVVVTDSGCEILSTVPSGLRKI